VRKLRQEGFGITFFDVVLPRAVSGGAVQLLLTWTAPQYQLEAYLKTPSRCTVSQSSPKCRKHTDTAQAEAVFDTTRCKGDSPQAITIKSWEHGEYLYYVRHRRKNVPIEPSRAVVTLIQKRTIRRSGRPHVSVGWSGGRAPHTPYCVSTHRVRNCVPERIELSGTSVLGTPLH
jgi:hypothetical protein